ncbi:hypothetical protein NDU88_007516 [Pleurodeles waltl]|uniref:Uncharacterized protein n=1 Tax=Pleurodeles waltl TaxID=8319 RepID=A0AAV7U1Q5_PLEWA|nr:hypothetical protein NDU88_007516 [Pleurodeles waltl]
MGKGEQQQAKLSFDGSKQKGGTPAPQPGEVQMDDGPSDVSVKSMFMDLKSSLAGIDAKLDHLTGQMDRIWARVDEHNARFEQLESCTSEMEDQRHGERERLLQMERVLERYCGHTYGLLVLHFLAPGAVVVDFM